MPKGAILESRYLIEGILGIGGMGAVYLARDLRFSVIKNVAVKEMVNKARDHMMRETIVKNFEREANILATLNHPAIPTIYDFFTQGDRSYLVMEFVRGKNIETLMNQADGFFPEDQIITWSLEICDVLEYLHNHEPNQIIFRDIKPSNIMIDESNRLILVDFGIAKPFEMGEKGTMIGTEGYSPPEQYRGEASVQVDIYALGATMHHLLTKRDPRIEAPFTFTDRPVREINPSISVDLETIVNSALQYNPEDRFKSAGDFKEALLNVARKTGLLTSIPASINQNSTDQAIKPIWQFECEDEIRGTPAVSNGKIYIGAYDNNLYALDAETGEFDWKYAADGGIVSCPAIYDNNIYFGSEDHRVHVISQFSGRIVWTYYTDGPVRSSPTIAERHVFIGSDDGHMHTINAMNGRKVMKVDAGSPIRCKPLVADGLVYFGSQDGDFWCVDFRGNVKWRFRAKRAITSSPIVDEGIVYFASLDSTLYALDAKTGWSIWRYRMGKGSISSPGLAENLVFIGSVDNNIYAIDIRNGKEVWRFSSDHQITSSPVVYKDSLYFGGIDGYIYCLEYRTGRFRWKFKTGDSITGTPAIVNDIIFIGSMDHHIYALPA